MASNPTETKQLARAAVARYRHRKYKARLQRLQARSEAIGRQATDRAVEGEKSVRDAKGRYGDL